MMTCRFCNKDLPADALFCCFCGKKQKAPERSPKRRGNGQGTVFKCGNGYAAEVTLGYISENGKLKRKSRRKKGFKTKREAAAYLETLRSLPEKQASITISELYKIFSDTSKLSHTKTVSYQIAYNRIAPTLSYRKIDSLTVADLQAVVDSTASTYSTQRDIKQLLNHLYKIALRDDLVDKNRATFITLVENNPAEKQIFTEAEIEKLWNDYRNTADIISASALIMLYTGMRPGEVRGLKVENIHLDEHYMTGGIKTTKGKRRKIIIPDKIMPIMQSFVNQGGFFSGSDMKYLQHHWNDKRSALALNPALTLHCCRHTYLTRLTALNVSPAMLQELAGHEDYETTLNYTHLSVADRLEAVNKL